jgi:tRNA-2-methylthio-N6-dimethylallyladenosine synthase
MVSCVRRDSGRNAIRRPAGQLEQPWSRGPRRPPEIAMSRFCVVTFGCQMNQHDSLRIGELMREAGSVQTQVAAEADLIVLNTCSVRAKAEQKLRSELGRLARLRRAKPALRICVAGCVAEQEGERLLARSLGVDLVLGPDNIRKLPELVAELETGGQPRVETGFDLDAPQFLAARPEFGSGGPCAYLTVMKGCDERCAFCIVPRTRGPERYRRSGEILEEVERLVDSGVREITLLGQTVNSYHDPSGALPPAPGAGESPWVHTPQTRARNDESEFPALLRAVAARAPDLVRLRYTAPHPRHLTLSLIRAHRELPVLAAHVHLPVQSGSDAVLKRMVRRHTVAEYRERVAVLLEAVPGLALTTDIIVGFPGESREDFERTLDLVREVGFMGLFGFKYSPRPDTPAIRLVDDVNEAEKSRRLAQLFELSNAIRQAHLSALVGTVQPVLVEGAGERGGYSGRTGRNEIVHFPCVDDPTGQLLEVRITEPYKNSLAGRVEDSARTSPASGGPDGLRGGERQTASKRRPLPVV